MNGGVSLAVAAAVVAVLAYGSATVLQALAVARARHRPGAGGLLRRLLAQRLYVAGLALDLVGFLCGAVAQRALPLFAVQSALAASIGVTALLSRRVLGTRLRPREVVALTAMGGGLLLLAAGAGAAGEAVPAGDGVLAGLPGSPGAALLVVAAVLALGLPLLGRHPGLAAPLAGLAGGVSALAARVFVLPHPWWLLVLQPGALALALSGAVCAWAFAVALESGSPAAVTATCFGVSTVLPALVGVGVLGDTVRPGWAPAVVLGVVLVLACAAVLGRFSAPTEAPPGTGAPADRVVSVA